MAFECITFGFDTKALFIQDELTKLRKELYRAMEARGDNKSSSNSSQTGSTKDKCATKVTKKDSQSEPRKCYFCGKPGHFVRDCHKLKKLKKGQTGNSATADQKTAPKPSLN